jgi:hypothetical protein
VRSEIVLKMDLITHGIVGFACGGPMGAVGAILPDLPMYRRWRKPPLAYRITHSVWPCLASGFLSPELAIGWASHLLLDAVSHGPVWAPRLFAPLVDWSPSGFEEWEWGNRSHRIGLIFAICISLFALGYHL